MMHSVSHGQSEISWLMVEAGADISARDNVRERCDTITSKEIIKFQILRRLE